VSDGCRSVLHKSCSTPRAISRKAPKQHVLRLVISLRWCAARCVCRHRLMCARLAASWHWCTPSHSRSTASSSASMMTPLRFALSEPWVAARRFHSTIEKVKMGTKRPWHDSPAMSHALLLYSWKKTFAWELHDCAWGRLSLPSVLIRHGPNSRSSSTEVLHP